MYKPICRRPRYPRAKSLGRCDPRPQIDSLHAPAEHPQRNLRRRAVMCLPEESPPRIQHMHKLPGLRLPGGNYIRAKNPRMPARQAVHSLTADLYRCDVQLPMFAGGPPRPSNLQLPYPQPLAHAML